MGIRGDMRMLERAIRHRWLTDDLKPAALDAIRRGMESGDPRAEQTAVRNLLAMEAQNQKDEHAKVDEFNERILSIARRCGVNVDLFGFGEETAGGAEARIESADGTADGRTR
jgi:regulator of RNase E activity RraB